MRARGAGAPAGGGRGAACARVLAGPKGRRATAWTERQTETKRKRWDGAAPARVPPGTASRREQRAARRPLPTPARGKHGAAGDEEGGERDAEGARGRARAPSCRRPGPSGSLGPGAEARGEGPRKPRRRGRPASRCVADAGRILGAEGGSNGATEGRGERGNAEAARDTTPAEPAARTRKRAWRKAKPSPAALHQIFRPPRRERAALRSAAGFCPRARLAQEAFEAFAPGPGRPTPAPRLSHQRERARAR